MNDNGLETGFWGSMIMSYVVPETWMKALFTLIFACYFVVYLVRMWRNR